MQESCQGISKPEYTLDVGLANARLVPDACQGNYFLQIGKNTCKNFILFGGL